MGPLLAKRGAAMGRVQAELDAGWDDAAIQAFLDYQFAPAGFDTLSVDERAVMRDNAGVLRPMLRAVPAPFTREQAGAIRAPALLLTGERSRRLFTVTLDALERCVRSRSA